MVVLVPTFGEKFRSLIKCCILWMKEDVNLFTDAESANFGDGIVALLITSHLMLYGMLSLMRLLTYALSVVPLYFSFSVFMSEL